MIIPKLELGVPVMEGNGFFEKLTDSHRYILYSSDLASITRQEFPTFLTVSQTSSFM